MSPQRLADSAHVVPYPTHAAHNHDQPSSSTADYPGRSSDSKVAQPRNRAGRHERSPRRDDEIRFNVGPPKPRQTGRRRTGQSNGRLLGEEAWRSTEPPPGYEEAIGTPPLSGCPSTVTLATTINATPLAQSLSILVTSSSEAATHGAAASSLRAESPHPGSPDSDSGGSLSLENISMEDVNEPLTPTQAAVLRHPYGQDFQQNPSGLLHRRNRPLSPLRTLFPFKSRVLNDVPHSAHPIPESPYNESRSTFSAFRSTTSLSTLSLGRFASSDGNPPKHRRLFSFKGKGRAKDLDLDGPSADDWEEVPSEVEGSVDARGREVVFPPSKKDSARTKKPQAPDSAMSSPQIATPELPKATKQPVMVSPISNTPVPSVRSASPAPSHLQSQAPTRSTYSRDEKVRDMYMSFSRPRPTQAAPPPPPPPPVLIEPPQGPIVTTVRTRKYPSPPSTPKPTDVFSGTNQGKAELEYQRALATPLPDTPKVESSYFAHVAEISTGGNLSEELHRPSREPSPSPSIKVDAVSSAHLKPGPDLQDHQSVVFPLTDYTNPSLEASSLDLMSSMRHHYPGRPLPRPPGARTTPHVVDSAFEPFGVPLSSEPSLIHIDKTIPEGLLIDLDGEVKSVESHNNSPIPSIPNSPVESHSSGSTIRLAAFPPLPPSPSPPLSPVSTQAPRPSPLHETISPVQLDAAPQMRVGQALHAEYTDLDILVDRVSRDSRDGSDYDALLLVSEFLGPAIAESGPAALSSSSPCDMMLQGRIEVERRRVTRDGRRKLKLSLLGVGVERCAICMSQFKEKEEAEMVSTCKHVFHARCIGRWVGQGNSSCPLCRAPLR